MSQGLIRSRKGVILREESGASRARTGDLQRATLALSQLSYGPVAAQCSGELELPSPMNSESLVVLGGGQAKEDLLSGTNPVKWKVVTTLLSGQ
jgi:hypothetical protein